MKPWVSTIRRASGLVEHICKCGVGHPAYGSVHWMELHGRKTMGVHGCCGCCQDKDWQIADLKEGVEIANKNIVLNKNINNLLAKENKQLRKDLKKLVEAYDIDV